jgi:hypothetical protein
LKLAATIATVGLLLLSVTIKPAGGAGPLSVTVPVELKPPATGAGLNVMELITAGFTVSMPVALLVPSIAVTVTWVVMATPTVAAVNVWVVLPAETTTLPGTVAEGSPLLNMTAVPPTGAA